MKGTNPLANKVDVPPVQIEAGVAVADKFCTAAFTVTSVLAWEVQPLASVPVTV